MECIADSIDSSVSGFYRSHLKLLGKSCHWDDTRSSWESSTLLPIFSDGGIVAGPAKAVDHACDMVQAGAGIIDIGGESSRPARGKLTPARRSLE
jgi:hypothetical protein